MQLTYHFVNHSYSTAQSLASTVQPSEQSDQPSELTYRGAKVRPATLQSIPLAGYPLRYRGVTYYNRDLYN
ncbi:MAG: hypothetical protein Fur0046_31990 [Cyanobacteria bacterium J069]|nr:MAG: DUF4278 domain-containing protein [Cyanobacteria bacterium J069]